MSDHDGDNLHFTGGVRQWRPRLIRVTKAPHPEINDGEPTAMFIDPTTIVCVERGVVEWQLANGVKAPIQEVSVITTYRAHCFVLESPETVAASISAEMNAK